jgi:oligopeptide/dipeptide ABC transporter ATP-binding protein
MSNDKILEVKGLKVYFDIKRSFAEDIFAKSKKQVKAVDGVSFDLRKGEILSLVGESGSGKTTTGKAILQLIKKTEGEIIFNDAPVELANKQYMRDFRQKAQMIFQDPYQSINPRDIVMDIVGEPLDVNKLVKTQDERTAKIVDALENAGLTPTDDYLYRYPYELSGGQRQRVVIASSMIMEPSFVVADEPVSMLDASIRTGILKLMLNLRDKKGISYLFITHDLSLAWLISDRIAIMYLGRIMEIGKSDDLIKRGLHPYTKALMEIMPKKAYTKGKTRKVLPGETPNPIDDIKGCKFSSRCPLLSEICLNECPELREVGAEHLIACHNV